MKLTYLNVVKIILIVASSLIMISGSANAQSCTPQGNQASYGTNNVWIGYAYQGKNFNTYKGYVNEGTAGNSNFDESFGGATVSYNTHGCSVYTDTFSMRYKLTKSFADGNYAFEVGGDDGYRLSLDGGSTWAINNWGDHSYTTTTYTVHLNGSVNMVLEYYENFIDNRVSFSVSTACVGNGDPTVYGGGVWSGYLYQGMNFEAYKGFVTKGTAANPNFDESFGGDNITYGTSNCSIQTEKFSARYRMTKTLAAGTYVFTVGGDDGYRFSLNGGASWVINKWNDQSYGVTSYTASLNGTYNMVIEYYENGGGNRLSFSMSATLLPVKLVNWSGEIANSNAQLQWKCTNAVNFDRFVVQRSFNGIQFDDIQTIKGVRANTSSENTYAYQDKYVQSDKVYYRLMMVDLDGSVNYSSIINLSVKNSGVARMYPTIVDNGTVTVESGKPVAHAKLDIFDMSGRNLFSKNLGAINGRQEVDFANGSHLASGSYIAVVSEGAELLIKKILIIK